MRAVVDTNVWISAILNPSGSPAEVLSALRAGTFTLVTSEPLLLELAEVLQRPRITSRYGITAEDVAELLELLRERAELATIPGTLHLCRDPDDDMIIETAFVGRASVIVSRDDDLKASAEVATVLGKRGIAVSSVRRFLAALLPSAGS